MNYIVWFVAELWDILPLFEHIHGLSVHQAWFWVAIVKMVGLLFVDGWLLRLIRLERQVLDRAHVYHFLETLTVHRVGRFIIAFLLRLLRVIISQLTSHLFLWAFERRGPNKPIIIFPGFVTRHWYLQVRELIPRRWRSVSHMLIQKLCCLIYSIRMRHLKRFLRRRTHT